MVFLIMEVLECLWVMEDMDLGLKISATIPLTIVDFISVVIKVVTIEEVGICLKIPSSLPF